MRHNSCPERGGAESKAPERPAGIQRKSCAKRHRGGKERESGGENGVCLMWEALQINITEKW